jgi:8-oxo-dGTP pyrophosphatase MutT (NUDIX family)
MTCGIPHQLITEVLTALAETQQLKGRVVLDLCAGFQSIREAVLKAGATYVGVDLKGSRGSQQQPQPRRGAIVLCHNKRVLAVKHRNQDGSCGWMIPGGSSRSPDMSLHHTALRELKQQTGLGHEGFRGIIRAGPQLVALENTTYFTYALNSPIPQAELARSFAGRRDNTTILDMAWVNQCEAKQLLWRKEDEAVLQRVWQLPLYLGEEGRGGC